MASSHTVRWLHIIGGYWFAVVLVCLIVASIAFAPVREFVNSRHILIYLALYLVLITPGFVILMVAERLKRER